jgi:long-chain fatty acid transport protein
MDIDIEGDADFTQISTGNAQLDALVAAQLPPDQGISTTIPFPSHTTFGIARTGERWDVDLDISYTGWSTFETLVVEFDQTPGANLNSPQNWDDSFSVRLGGNGRVTEHWDVRLGALYDQTPQPTEVVGPLLPDSDRVAATMGLGFHSGPWVIDGGVMFLEFLERDTEGQNLDGFNGTYLTHANLYFVNVGVRF